MVSSTTKTSAAKAAQGADKTTAGNYFVANYPPFSFWRPDRCGDVADALQRLAGPDTPLGMYVHIPFCRQRCHFCYFRIYTGRDAGSDQVRQYVDALRAEMELYGDRPLIAGRRPRYVYFGGGTPSFLSPQLTRRLIEGLRAHLPWDDVEEVTFECEPGTLNDAKLATLHDLGITRISLGVENFNDLILKTNNRGHSLAHIHRAYDAVRQAGFGQVNVDLIAGMVNETDENWQDCVRRTIELEPDCVTIYQMEIPYNSIIYRQMQEQDQAIAPVADWPTKRRWVGYAFGQLEAAGYTVTSGYTAVRDPAQYRFLYRDYLWRSADMVSLGVASFGHLGGTHYQNEHHMGPYLERVRQGDLPLHRALTMTDQERLLREVILQLKLGYLDQEYFGRKFATDILQRFAEPLERLEQDGYLRRTPGRVELTREGLLRVDTLLEEFFLVQHRNARYT